MILDQQRTLFPYFSSTQVKFQDDQSFNSEALSVYQIQILLTLLVFEELLNFLLKNKQSIYTLQLKTVHLSFQKLIFV